MNLTAHSAPPNLNEAEITLLGAGAYGESVVIHIGENRWIVVDSCINPNDRGVPLPIAYLSSIGVTPDRIELIVCTHWHDDHIRGISKMLELAVNSDFCISRASDKNKFLRFVGMDSGKPINYSTKEFTNCLKILMQRSKNFIDAIENRPLIASEFAQLTCLSPSDFTAQKFDIEIASLMEIFNFTNKRIPYSSPNAKSIVLFVKLGTHRAILGADLEVADNDKEGWIRILNNKISIDKRSSLIKISHHGSENGYHIGIWDELLYNNPIAKLTPWKLGGNSIPEQKMVDKYKSHTNKLFITEHVISNKQKSRDTQIEKLIRTLKSNIQEIKYKLGIIRSRIEITNSESEWKVELIEGSKQIS